HPSRSLVSWTRRQPRMARFTRLPRTQNNQGHQKEPARISLPRRKSLRVAFRHEERTQDATIQETLSQTNQIATTETKVPAMMMMMMMMRTTREERLTKRATKTRMMRTSTTTISSLMTRMAYSLRAA
ncbi:hypothetical protein BGX33_004635, partial [Mortierella sp. NVP41]